MRLRSPIGANVWGDAKLDDKRGRDDFEGNKYLHRIWVAVNEGRYGEVPPILHFSKTKKGQVSFSGVAVLIPGAAPSAAERGY